MKTLEIVTHCWNYANCLTWQLASVLLFPPAEPNRVVVTVFIETKKDQRTVERMARIMQWPRPDNVDINVYHLPKTLLCRRAIGRNIASQRSTSDIMWFADCDMMVGKQSIDRIIKLLEEDNQGHLWYPRTVKATQQEDGDRLISEGEDMMQPRAVDTDSMFSFGYRKAVGGVQFARTSSCRQIGYCARGEHQNRAEEWRRTYSDITFRESMHEAFGCGNGRRVKLPNLIRFRHTERGRFTKGLEL